jgi:hypothetical protein
MYLTKSTVLLDLLHEYRLEICDGLKEIAEFWENEPLRAEVFDEVWAGL